jgi:hypothetical protein
MTLQPFLGPRLLFQFLDFLHSRYDSLDGGSVVTRPLPTHRTQTQNKRTETSMSRVGFEPMIPAFEDSSWFTPRGHCDRPSSSTLRLKYAPHIHIEIVSLLTE